MADHFSESMPIVPEKLFTSALVTHTQSVTHTHIHRLLSSTSLLYTHTHTYTHMAVLSCLADREQAGIMLSLSLFLCP